MKNCKILNFLIKLQVLKTVDDAFGISAQTICDISKKQMDEPLFLVITANSFSEFKTVKSPFMMICTRQCFYAYADRKGPSAY